MGSKDEQKKLRYTPYSGELPDLKEREQDEPLPVSVSAILKNLLSDGGDVLDVGCGAGDEKLLQLLPYCKSYVGVEPSKELRESFSALGADLDYGDRLDIRDGKVGHLAVDQKFDLIISRLAPHDSEEAFRFLRPGGHYFVYKVGPLDKRKAKKYFGKNNQGNWRGYRCNQREGDRRRKLEKQFAKAGFEQIISSSFFRDCYYPQIEDFILLLEAVPFTVEDFDITSDRDQQALARIDKELGTQRGIKVRKHEIMVIGKKED